MSTPFFSAEKPPAPPSRTIGYGSSVVLMRSSYSFLRSVWKAEGGWNTIGLTWW